MRRSVFSARLRFALPIAGILVAAAAVFGPLSSTVALAQSGDIKTQDKPTPGPNNAAEAVKDVQRKVNEFAEASQAINGPAGNPECVWLGRRVVSLMWRDDLDTAFRHLDLYDRFGCPGGHIQATFRCLVRAGVIDPKVPESLNNRVHACWINPQLQASEQPAAKPPAAPEQQK